MKFTLLALTLAAAMATPHLDDAVFCSHTTCYMVMKITHSNEETKCQKHTSKHSTDAKITWEESGNAVHCKVSNTDCKIPADCNCKCSVQGTNGPLITPEQGNDHDIEGYDTPHGTAQVYHSTDETEQLIVPQKRTNEKDEAAATQKATRTGKRQDTFEDTNNHGF